MISLPIQCQALLLGLLYTLGACGGGGASSAATSTAPPVVVPAPPAPPPDIRILVIGQSIASNCNEKVYGPSPNVLQIGLTGDVKAASDPFEWADCKQGSMWMPLGKLMVDTGMASSVTFMPIGIGGTSVADWQEGGAAFPKLNDAIRVMQQRGLQFDYAFWHQGSSDFGTKPEVYKERLISVINFVTKNVKIDRWLVATHSRCFGKWDRDIEAAQRGVAAVAGDNIFPGPDNNTLDESYRFDTCHLNAKGQETMAGLWLEAIKNAK